MMAGGLWSNCRLDAIGIEVSSWRDRCLTNETGSMLFHASAWVVATKDKVW